MISQSVNLPMTHSAIQIIHQERHNTGGFSTLWVSPDCSDMVTISDYSQAEDKRLDQPVRRSGWYQAKLIFNQDDRLKGLNFFAKGQLKDLDGSILQGAVESMAWDKGGFLISFDDRGSIYRYAESDIVLTDKPSGFSLNSVPTVAYSQENFGQGNFGLESITLLNNGDLLALWETKADEMMANGRLLKADGRQIDLSYATGASPGGATTLNDGSLLILEKRWLGVKKGQRLRLVQIDSKIFSDPLASQNIQGTAIFDHISTQYDNNEGISACKKNGKEWIFIITDDNGDWNHANVEGKGRKRQRTLLFQISLDKLIKQNAIN